MTKQSDKTEAALAKKFFQQTCGILHLSWALDRYWGLVTQEVILPSARVVYDELVKKDHTESNRCMWGDADGHIFYIPDGSRKVFVHTTQTINYLYIIEDSQWGRFDIRRFYQPITKDHYSYQEVMSGTRSIQKILGAVETLKEFSDDDKKYLSSRPSLEAYRRVEFQIPFTKEHMRERSFYGDFRDPGFLLSYEFFQALNVHPRVEGSKYSFAELETLATCHLPSIADQLEIEVPTLKGYDR